MNSVTQVIIDLSGKETDSREWQELEQHVKEYASQAVREIMLPEGGFQLPSSGTGNGDSDRETRHVWEMELIRQGLERYRTEPSDSNIRRCIDWLLKRHACWERFMQSDTFFQKRHNALVLEYIISHPMKHAVIEKRLRISDNGFKKQIEKGISELAQILFYYRE